MPNTPRKRDPEAASRKILQAAKQLLIDGDGHFEMSWVAKAAGVSQGLAYHHFGSKDGLMSAVVNDFYDRVEADSLMARLDGIDDWETRERERTRRYIRFLFNDPLTEQVLERLAGTGTVAAVETARWQKLIDTGARNMAEGQSRGAVTPHIAPRLLAAMTLGAIRSAVSSEFSNPNKLTADRLTDTLWVFVWRGLTNEEKA